MYDTENAFAWVAHIRPFGDPWSKATPQTSGLPIKGRWVFIPDPEVPGSIPSAYNNSVCEAVVTTWFGASNHLNLSRSPASTRRQPRNLGLLYISLGSQLVPLHAENLLSMQRQSNIKDVAYARFQAFFHHLRVFTPIIKVALQMAMKCLKVLNMEGDSDLETVPSQQSLVKGPEAISSVSEEYKVKETISHLKDARNDFEETYRKLEDDDNMEAPKKKHR
uniref:Uncharacterized protein n=1 Tax=Timema shepardi TaxID=629360 RepID=A0A7R9G0R5_TIMSH|nr:unnamed protein product [Timema shepardi]